MHSELALVAINLAPAAALAALRTVWDAGDAAVVLPPEPQAAARTIAALRPDRILTRHGEHPGPGGTQLPAGTGVVVATSGSTGTPKGVVLSHHALAASTSRSVARLGARPGERFVLALPLHHIAGLQVALRSWACGTEPAITTDWRRIDASYGTHVSLVPTQLRALLAGGAPLAGFRSVLVGGAALDADTAAQARDAQVALQVSYGMTETSGGCVYDGVPFDDVEVAVDAEGRLRVRGPVLLTGVLDDDGEVRRVTDDAGWFTTGDLGRVVDGRVVVDGRADEVIVSGGENVPAGAVAAVLRRLPGVADAAVVGRRDPVWGQAVTAVVVPCGPAPDLATLRAQVAEELPRGWAPRRLVIVAELPVTALGKLDREVLEARLTAAEG